MTMLLGFRRRCLGVIAGRGKHNAKLAAIKIQSRRITTDGLSIRWGPREPSLFDGTIPQHFASVVATHGNRPAVVARDPLAAVGDSKTTHETTLTYTDLDRISNRLANALRTRAGVRKGDRVAVSLGNGAAFAALTYACFKLGAILVPLNPTFNAIQVRAALRHLDVGVLIIGAVTDLAYRPARGRSNQELLESVVGDLRDPVIRSSEVPSLAHVIVVDNRLSHTEINFPLEECRALTPFSSLLEDTDSPVTPDEPLRPDDTINIQFTSGTTALPKAAMLSHSSILNNGALIANRMGLEPSDRIVVPPPLFHCFGCVLGYMATATTGATIMFPSPAFDPVATLRMCVEHDATGLYGVNTMLIAVLEALERGDVVPHAPKSLRKGIVAGSSVPESFMRTLYERLGLQDLVICYGMTETSPVSCMTRPSDPFDKRTASVGTPMSHTGVKIVSPQDRTALQPLGVPGELAAAGYLVMQGYYNDPDRTAEARAADADGVVWIYSGDEAVMDENGFVHITGRIKDLIIRGGENIHPLEVEECLVKAPGVREASVVGIPDDRLGEAVAAFVIPARGWSSEDAVSAEAGSGQAGKKQLLRSDLQEWVAKGLSKHLVPKHIFYLDEYPKTASGKVQKFKLRDMAKDVIAANKGEDKRS